MWFVQVDFKQKKLKIIGVSLVHVGEPYFEACQLLPRRMTSNSEIPQKPK